MQTQRVLLIQLPVPNNPATNTPLAAGYLRAYARSQGLLETIEITIMARELADYAGDAALVEAIAAYAPQILGLSLYTWNSERTLAIAERAKAILPGLIVIGGGPEVQHDNTWLLAHPGIDIAVVGEGEQTFVDLLRAHAAAQPSATQLAQIPGIIFRDRVGTLIHTPERVALAELSEIPSPYLNGDLPVRPGDMLMVEVSRWCPYACSFCLYGRNMGPKLGGRYFPLERLLAEIRYGRDHGITQVHFIEANLNLVPPFQELMHALAEINAAGGLALYAELRGEHVSEQVSDALAKAGLRVAEVGLQTANPLALKLAHRRTDLQKWAAGTRRLYARNVEVLLDVILGLPGDDAEGVAQTLAFIEQEQLGAYDAFTLQVLPGTAVRQQASEYALQFQDHPPYYILATDRLSYAELRRLRRELKQGIGLDPDAVEGCPLPHFDALARVPDNSALVDHIDLRTSPDLWPHVNQLANHVDIIADTILIEETECVAFLWLQQALLANPSTLFDLYLLATNTNEHATLNHREHRDTEEGQIQESRQAGSISWSPRLPVSPSPDLLITWRDKLAYTPGYLDRVAVYRREEPQPHHVRVSPRIWLVVPWVSQIDAQEYRGVAEIIWEYPLAPGEEPPLRAWQSAGGAGIWVRGPSVSTLRQQTDLWLWEGGIGALKH